MALLDNLPSGATAAYGFSKLLNSYVGSACRVRRSSDSAETDIGFDANGYLDVATLASFQGTAAETTLVTLYDQTGNGNHATQSSASAQPLIGLYSGGSFSMASIHPVSGRYGINFNGAEFLDAPNIYSISNFSALSVFTPNAVNLTEQFLYNLSTGGLDAVGFDMNRNVAGSVIIRHDLGTPDFSVSGTGLVQGQPAIVTDFMNGTSLSTTAYLDGVAFTGTSSGRRNLTDSFIGSRDNAGYFLDGDIYSLIVYQSDESANATSINAELDLFYNSYPLSGTNITTGNASVGSATASEYTQTSAPTLLENLPSGVHSAYAFSKLRQSYTGYAIRIRRDSDNAELDIGFDVNGYLDTSAIQTFQGGAANTRLVTWYDQSGNGNDITQTTASLQPYVANTAGGWSMYSPAYSGSNRYGAFFGATYFQTTDFYDASGFSSILVLRPFQQAIGEQAPFNIYDGSSSAVGHLMNRTVTGRYSIRHDATSKGTSGLQGVSEGFNYIITDFKNASNFDVYLDNSPMVGTDAGRIDTSGSYIGTLDNTGSYDLYGYIYCLVFYQSDQGGSSTSIYNEVDSFFSTYGITASSITTGAVSIQDADLQEIVTYGLSGLDITTGSILVPTSNISTFPVVFASTLLDRIPSGTFRAYALDKINPNYNGAAVRVRRDDGAELDIGFDAFGYFDVATLEVFQGTSPSTRIAVWYDQSGSNNNINAFFFNNMPRLATYSSGAFQGMNAPLHEGSLRHGAEMNDSWFFMFGSYTPSGFTVISETQPFLTPNKGVLLTLASGSDYLTHSVNMAGGYNHVVTHSNVSKSSPPHVAGQFVTITDYKSASSFDAYYEGNLMTGSITGVGSVGFDVFGAANAVPDEAYQGNVYALIMYQSDQSANSALINQETLSYFNNQTIFGYATSSSSPVLSAPTILQIDILSANPVTSGVPVLSTSTLGSIYNITALNITAYPYVLSSPFLYTDIVNPVVPQTNIIVNGQKLHIFPDYKIGLSLNYSAGSIEGLEAAISDRFELPFDDYNAGILGINLGSLSAGQRFDCQIEDEASNTIYDGYLEVVSANIQTLYRSIEVRFVDRVKQFINTLKDTKLHELITAGEFDHDFQLAKPADTFSGVETLISNSDFVRYVYTDYNGFDNLNVAALHRYNEDFAGGDGIQHLQPAFKVNEFIDRIETFTGETINSQFFSNSISGIDTDKLYFQMPMRYHGFNTALREDEVRLKFSTAYMLAGFPEAGSGGTNLLNYRVKNRAINQTHIRTDIANNFSIFMEQSALTTVSLGQQSALQFKSLVLRSGTYKIAGSLTIPELNISYIDPSINTSNIFVQGIESFTGDVTLNLGVIINDGQPELIPVKTYNHTDFSTSASTSATVGGVTYYNFLRAASDTVNYESDEIELRMGDRVMYTWVLTGEGEAFNVGRENSTGTTQLFQGLSVTDMANTTGYSNLIFTFGTSISSLVAPFSSTNSTAFNLLSGGSLTNHNFTISASKEYPLMGIPQFRLSPFFVLTFDYEEVDFKENVKAFADISVYDILIDIMGRFNMGGWYNHSNGEFYFDNFAEQFIRSATAQNIKPNFDDDEVLSIDLQLPNVKSIELQNEKGEAQDDIVLLDYAFGTYPNEVLDQDSDKDLSYSSTFSLATGTNYGEDTELTDPLSPSEKFLRFYSKNQNFQVSDYGMRIGFLSNDTKKITIGTPHPANFFIANSTNVHDFVRYKARQNSAFILPTFQQIDQTNNLTLEFAIEENGELNPEPATITTTYEKFWKWYVENMFGTVGFEGSFVFSKADIKSLSPLQTYDFGYGDCIIESIDSFDLTQEKDKVRIKLRKI